MFFGSAPKTNEARINNITFQQTGYNNPIALCIGSNRVYLQWIDYVGFRSTQHTESAGGKGLFGGGSGSYFTYNVTLAGLICHGPIRGYGKMWKDKDRHPTQAEIDKDKTGIGALGFHGELGADTQSAWDYFISKYPDHALPYRGIALLYGQDLDLGRSVVIGQYSVETFGLGLSDDSQAQNYVDAHVSDAISIFLSYAHFPQSAIGDLFALHTYCAAHNILISPLLDTQKAGYEWLKEFIFIAGAAAFWSEGRLKFKPFSDSVAANEFATFEPDLTIACELFEADIIDIRPVKKSKIDTFNWIAIEYVDRDQDYSNSSTYASSQGDIEQFGLRKKDARSLKCIHSAAVARLVAQNDLQHELYLDYRGFEIDVSIDFDFIEPMDFIRLNCQRFGLIGVRFRVVAVNDDGDKVTLTIKEALEGVAHSGEHTGINGGFVPDYIGTPALINPPIIFVAPAQLSASGGEIWMGISCPDPLYGGCDIWLSYDNATYKKLTTHTVQSITGSLTANFSKTASVMAVDVSECAGVLDSFTQQAFDLKDSLCLVGNEFLAYKTAALTGANQYALSVFQRGLYGTSAGALAGDRFLLCDSSLVKRWFKEDLVGKTVYLKFQGFNIIGTGYQDLDDLPAYSFVVTTDGRITNSTLTFYQPTAAKQWLFAHNLGRAVNVDVFDDEGNQFRAVVKQLKDAQGSYSAVQINFPVAIAGFIIIS